jgi:pseudaminic acid biosynthesis-associated methylase
MSNRTSQVELWKSEFGNDYSKRNQVNPADRLEGFRAIVGDLNIQSALEVGCNRGHNLGVLRDLGINRLGGLEPNDLARADAAQRYPDANFSEGVAMNMPFDDSSYELVFTAGVLIHIAPTDVPAAMAEMYRISSRYVLSLEYFSPELTEVNYRGHTQALWKCDFGDVWQSQYPDLHLARTGHLDDAGVWDDVTWWLFEKSASSA